MSTNQNKNEEELDLGSLFIIIGKGFSNFFNFIGTIFKGFFHFLITVLIFLKNNFKKILFAGIAGLVLGLLLEINKPAIYGSELLVEPNFNSSRQLYNNVNYYNDLVRQKDTAIIQKIFNLNKEYAASIEEFTIGPIKLENDIIEA
jgi:hypothetical protein